jgi:ABC-2 type transport system ATP-binding protein
MDILVAMAVIETEGVRKVFRRRFRRRTVAVDGLDLEVPEGGVFGFLGPNGSGKTTTIRMALGLVAPTDGSVRLLGEPVPGGLAHVIGQVGALVEAPTFLPTLSGRQNLQVLARVAGIGDRRVDEVLEQVGLGERGGDRVKTYSLGMKQRLGVAAALLKDPPLLVLDEPANGLDPAGIREVRELIRRIGAEGRTVFLSSHLLGEVQQVCDRVAIISRGHMISQGPVQDVLAGGQAPELRVTVAHQRQARKVLRDAGYAVKEDGADLLVAAGPTEASLVTRTLAQAGLYLSGLRPEVASLESVFLELTGE